MLVSGRVFLSINLKHHRRSGGRESPRDLASGIAQWISGGGPLRAGHVCY